MAGVIVVERIPWLLIAPYTASLADRKDRLRLAAIAQTIRLLLAAVFALLLSLNLSGIVLLYLFVFLITALETAYDSAVFALVPQVVPDQDLEKVNGRLQAAQTVSLQFAGPPAAALLFRIAPALAFWANSITFAISALILHRRQPKVSPDAASDAHQDAQRDEPAPAASEANRDNDWRLGIRLVARHAPLREIAIVLLLLTLSAGAAEAVLVLFAIERLGLSELGYSLLFVGMGAGGVLGGLAASRVTALMGTRAAWITSTLTAALCTLAIAIANSGVLVGALLTVQGVAVVVANVASVSFRQRIVPLVVMARVGAVFRIIAMGCLAVGAGLGGVIASIAGLAAPFILAGVLGFLATVVLAVRFHTWNGDQISADPLIKNLTSASGGDAVPPPVKSA